MSWEPEPERVQEGLYIKTEVGRGSRCGVAARIGQFVAFPKLHTSPSCWVPGVTLASAVLDAKETQIAQA